MKFNIKLSLNTFLDRMAASRMLTVLPDDIFITSFPKCGNTWVRFLVANLMFGNEEKVGFVNIERLVPDIYQNSDKKILRLKSPRILKSHECFDPRYKKVIYIIRDPRDAFISYFHFAQKMHAVETEIKSLFEEYLTNGISTFGTWEENYKSWQVADKTRILFLKYEDMKQDPKPEVIKIADFLRLDVNDDDISAAIENSSFLKMKSLEKVQGKKWGPTKNSDLSKSFIRKGSVGEWKEILTEDMIKDIEKKWGALMRELGYL